MSHHLGTRNVQLFLGELGCLWSGIRIRFLQKRFLQMTRGLLFICSLEVFWTVVCELVFFTSVFSSFPQNAISREISTNKVDVDVKTDSALEKNPC